MERSSANKEPAFVKKVWIVAGIVALVWLLLLFLQETFNVMLLILAGALIAIFFRGFANLIQRNTKLKHGPSLSISIIGTILIVIGIFWLIGAEVQSQITELSDTLPKTVQKA